MTQVSVEEGSAAFASENGLLYDASFTTLLRVPAGATEITIREGCTTIAAGAMEACASLATINAPASVTSISPDVFTSVPTVSLPAATAILGEAAENSRTEGSPLMQAGASGNQLTAMVALSSVDNGMPKVEPVTIEVVLPEGADDATWQDVGFSASFAELVLDDASEFTPEAADGLPAASLDSAESYSAETYPAINAVSPTGQIYRRYTAGGSTNKTYTATYEEPYCPIYTVSFIRHDSGYLYMSRSNGTWKVGIGSSYTAGVTSVYVGFFDSTGVEQPTSPGLLAVGASVSSTQLAAAKSAGHVVCIFFNGTENRTVTWEANGGSVSPSMTRSKVGSKVTSPIPVRAGYRCTGWYRQAALLTDRVKECEAGGLCRVPICGAVGSSAVDRYYAGWVKVTTLAWNSNGGSAVASTSQDYSSTAKVVLPTAVPTRTGYTFAGWFTAATGGTQVTANTALPSANTTYYAHWNAVTYTISYNLNYGTASPANRTSYTIETASFTLTNPTRTGYTFAGWSGTGLSGSGNKTVTIPQGSTGARSYTANWTANTYDVVFNGNGGTVNGVASWTANNPKVTFNVGYWTTVAAGVRAGYTFKGYYTATAGGTQIYKPSGSGQATCVNDGTYWKSSLWSYAGNTTFYAQWTANTIRTTWNYNGGMIDNIAGSTFRDTVYGSKTLGDALESVYWSEAAGRLSRPGYSFDGWYTAATGGAKVTQSTALPSSNTTYYAHWTAKTITITWDSQGGSDVAATKQTYSEGAKIQLPDSPIRNQHIFRGWFTGQWGQGEQVTTSRALPTGDTTYYADWQVTGPLVNFYGPMSPIWHTYVGSDGWRYGPVDGSTWWVCTYGSRIRLSGDQVTLEGAYADPRSPKRIVETVALSNAMDGVASAWLVVDGAEGSKSGSWLGSDWTSLDWHTVADVYLNGYGASTVTWDAGEGECDTERTEDVMPYDTVTAPAASRKGYIMAGWYDGTAEDAKLACKPGSQSPQVTGDVTYYARWVPAVSAVAPIQATVRLDILGTEDQAMDEDAPGYIESRCGEPLDVASVAFEAKAGASELFGAYVPDIELQALPGKDASWETGSPAFSFALDAAGDAAIEDDASKLAGLSMSGYEVRIPIAYRFAIPDSLLEEVLASIDPARFEQVTTPVCSVSYTVALA